MSTAILDLRVLRHVGGFLLQDASENEHFLFETSLYISACKETLYKMLDVIFTFNNVLFYFCYFSNILIEFTVFFFYSFLTMILIARSILDHVTPVMLNDYTNMRRCRYMAALLTPKAHLCVISVRVTLCSCLCSIRRFTSLIIDHTQLSNSLAVGAYVCT
ncbi:hypothetical protein PUN28_006401 [Cardiocondyla obscurior]|uniref:Uncharacterized protein n=1 Tax=Cardiocondyla obscurior TaxID=286306 RepID=A0AAW2G8G2_9HYME